MYSLKFVDDLKKLIEAVRSEDTGSREKLARSLNISINTLWKYQQILKKCNIPVRYSTKAQTYFFQLKEGQEVRCIWEFGLYENGKKISKKLD